jgi:hypothetical protein
MSAGENMKPLTAEELAKWREHVTYDLSFDGSPDELEVMRRLLDEVERCVPMRRRAKIAPPSLQYAVHEITEETKQEVRRQLDFETRARALLKRIEWMGVALDPGGRVKGDACPECCSPEGQGHRTGCELAALLELHSETSPK